MGPLVTEIVNRAQARIVQGRTGAAQAKDGRERPPT
jgi:hypothetical protein